MSSARMASSRIALAARVAIAAAVAVVTVEMVSCAKAEVRVILIKMAEPPTAHSCPMIPLSPLTAHPLPTANTVLKTIRTPVLLATPVGQWIVLDDVTAINVIVANRRIRCASGSALRMNTRRVSMLKACPSQWLPCQTSLQFPASMMPVNAMANGCTRCWRSRALARGATWKR